MLDVFATLRLQPPFLFAVIFSLASIPNCGCSSSQLKPGQTTITVLAAASLANAVAEVERQFECAHPEISVEVSCGPSNTLALQICAGAPADVFISASSRWSDQLQEQLPGVTSAPLLQNRLVLVVCSANPVDVRSLDDLLETNVQSIALAGENVPLGMYATQTLQAHGNFDSLERAGKIVRASDARATLAYIVRGEVDAGIVYATDAANEPRVTAVAELDTNDYDSIIYSAVLLPTANSTKSRMFFDFLYSEEAKQVFVKNGFIWNADSQPSH